MNGFGKKHAKLEELLLGVQDSHAGLHGKHGDLLKSHGKLQELLLAVQESHTGLHNKHAKMLSSHGKLEELLVSLHNGHGELHGKQAEMLKALHGPPGAPRQAAGQPLCIARQASRSARGCQRH